MPANFNGTADLLSLSSALITAYPLTVMAWMRPLGVNIWRNAALIVDTSTNTNAFWLGIRGDTNIIEWQPSLGGSNAACGAPNACVDDVWVHACGRSASAGVHALFVNGAQVASSAINLTPTGLNATYVGGGNFEGLSNPYFKGDLAWVSFHNAALSAGEIAEAAAGKPPWTIRPASLVACLLMDKAPGYDTQGRVWTMAGGPRVFLDSTFPGTYNPPYDHPRLRLASKAYTGAAINPTWSWSGSESAAVITASFKQGNFPGLISAIGNTTVTGANGGTSANISTAGADLLVAGIAQTDAVGLTTLMDSNSNTWTLVSTQNSGVVAEASMYYCANPVVSASHNFTVSGTGGLVEAVVSAWSKADTSAPLDQSSGNTSTGATSLSAGNITPTANNELILSFVAAGTGSSAFTVNSSLTKVAGADANLGTNISGWLGWAIQNTADMGIYRAKPFGPAGTQVGTKAGGMKS